MDSGHFIILMAKNMKDIGKKATKMEKELLSIPMVHKLDIFIGMERKLLREL